jgi:hypothetical protein
MVAQRPCSSGAGVQRATGGEGGGKGVGADGAADRLVTEGASRCSRGVASCPTRDLGRSCRPGLSGLSEGETKRRCRSPKFMLRTGVSGMGREWFRRTGAGLRERLFKAFVYNWGFDVSAQVESAGKPRQHFSRSLVVPLAKLAFSRRNPPPTGAGSKRLEAAILMDGVPADRAQKHSCAVVTLPTAMP